MNRRVRRFAHATAAGVDVTRAESAAIERIEAASAVSFHECAPDETADSLGLDVAEVAGVSLTLARRSDNLAFSRVMAVGLEEAAAREDPSRFVAWFRERKARRFSLDMSPCARPAEMAHWLASAGFRERIGAGKLIRGDAAIDPPETPFEVREIDGGEAATWFRVITTTWTVMRPHERWFAARVGHPGWRHYIATRAGQPVAAAALFVERDAARLTEAVTLAGHRRMGAHSALIARRIRDGIAAGVRTFTSETAPPLPRMALVSYANLLRAGFRLAYVRPSFVYDLRDR